MFYMYIIIRFPVLSIGHLAYIKINVLSGGQNESFPYIRHYMKNPLVLGTFLLTASGVLSRIIGFFYRIFLSHTIGAEGIGIYQLIFPLLALCSSFTTAGIQTAISKSLPKSPMIKTRAANAAIWQPVYCYLLVCPFCVLSIYIHRLTF